MVKATDSKSVSLWERRFKSYIYIKKYFQKTVTSFSSKLRHIHRQLGHPCKRVWMKMLKDAGLWYRESSKAVERIYAECGICKQNSNTPSNIEAGVRINTVT